MQSQMLEEVEEGFSLWSVRLLLNRHGVRFGGLKSKRMVASGTAAAVFLVVAWLTEPESIDLAANGIGL